METKKSSENMDIKFGDLDTKLSTLQDLILKMKTSFDLIAKDQINNSVHSQLIKNVEYMTNNFLNNRPHDCEVINKCTTKIHKIVMKILRIYSEKGHYKAIQLGDQHIASLDSYLEKGICQDDACLHNVKLIFTDIKDFLETTRQNSISKTKELLNLGNELELSEGKEEEESKIMSVLGNEHRIKILKELSKGSNYYSQLERLVGLKGGQFNFHLNELKDANFIESGKNNRGYSITAKGLKALKMIFEITKN